MYVHDTLMALALALWLQFPLTLPLLLLLLLSPLWQSVVKAALGFGFGFGCAGASSVTRSGASLALGLTTTHLWRIKRPGFASSRSPSCIPLGWIALCAAVVHISYIFPFLFLLFVFNLNLCTARCFLRHIWLVFISDFPLFPGTQLNVASSFTWWWTTSHCAHRFLWVKSVKKFIVSLRIRHVVRGMFKQTKNVYRKMENVNERRNYFSYAFSINVYSLAIRENLYCCINITWGALKCMLRFCYIQQFDVENFLNRF